MLIVAGVAGIGTIVEQAPWALDVVRWLGVGVPGLVRRDLAAAGPAPESLHAAAAGGARHGAAAVGRAVALTWLNPHVYLDTVLLLGSIANHQGATGRWWFALGACLASLLWFTGLGYGARLGQPGARQPAGVAGARRR